MKTKKKNKKQPITVAYIIADLKERQKALSEQMDEMEDEDMSEDDSFEFSAEAQGKLELVEELLEYYTKTK